MDTLSTANCCPNKGASRRDFLRCCGAGAAGLAVPGSLTYAKGGADNRPNILLIWSDDQGYGDLGCYGGDIPTPHLDALAEQGIRFTDFYSAAPICMPSRLGLISGLYPVRKDCWDIPWLPERLKSVGYRTAICGKWMRNYGGPRGNLEGSPSPTVDPLQSGFDLYSGTVGGCDYWDHTYYGNESGNWWIDNEKRNEEGYATDLITDYALDFLDSARDGAAPFFLWLSHFSPHTSTTGSRILLRTSPGSCRPAVDILTLNGRRVGSMTPHAGGMAWRYRRGRRGTFLLRVRTSSRSYFEHVVIH